MQPLPAVLVARRLRHAAMGEAEIAEVAHGFVRAGLDQDAIGLAGRDARGLAAFRIGTGLLCHGTLSRLAMRPGDRPMVEIQPILVLFDIEAKGCRDGRGPFWPVRPTIAENR